MLTGQASMQAPHSVEALGSSAASGWLLGQQRREHGADRSAVHPPVRVAADLAVDGAHVEAGAAADAAQDLLQLGAEHLAAAVVEDDDVQLVRTVDLALAARAGDDVGVRRDVLAGAPTGPAG